MHAVIQELTTEVCDNWPAFVFILMTITFSIIFLRQRRSEARMLKEMGEALEEDIAYRFDRLEDIILSPEKCRAQASRGPLSGARWIRDSAETRELSR